MKNSGRNMMVTFEEAFRKVMESAIVLGNERVELSEALNRVSAEDVVSDIDMPPFNKSAMDGYACRREDLEHDLKIVETIPAGKKPQQRIGPKQCAKIMTGGVVPEGADCVVMVEFTESPADEIIRFTGKSTRDNICYRGEDVRIGQVVFSKGEWIRPQHIAMLASVGCTNPLVAHRPKVGVIATGNELVEPEEKPQPWQIRNSNSYQVSAQIEQAGARPTNYGVAGDTEAEIEAAFEKAAIENDVVILSGGVSVGDYDVVPDVLKKKGVEIGFAKIAVKPGRPTVFGIKKEAATGRQVFCFGLPGNPVSTFVLFEILVKPFLYRLMGLECKVKTLSLRLEKTVSRKRAERDAWVPVRFTPGGGVVEVEYHGSAHIHSICLGDGLICIPSGISEIKEGTLVDVRPV
jgi:molybdopterin molybdotransferase